MNAGTLWILLVSVVCWLACDNATSPEVSEPLEETLYLIAADPPTDTTVQPEQVVSLSVKVGYAMRQRVALHLFVSQCLPSSVGQGGHDCVETPGFTPIVRSTPAAGRGTIDFSADFTVPRSSADYMKVWVWPEIIRKAPAGPASIDVAVYPLQGASS